MILFSAILAIASASGPVPSCYDTAMTTASMADCADAERKDSEKDLNAVYKQVMKRYAEDSAFKSKLKKAQRAWLAFRDLELQLVSTDGSISSMCGKIRLEQLNKERTEYLRSLVRKEEGDVCAP